MLRKVHIQVRTIEGQMKDYFETTFKPALDEKLRSELGIPDGRIEWHVESEPK
jgi:hypothetical protein